MQIEFEAPDRDGREQLFQQYMKAIKVRSEVTIPDMPYDYSLHITRFVCLSLIDSVHK
jgi:ATP-dependent 26S proteasome regulatory subunit